MDTNQRPRYKKYRRPLIACSVALGALGGAFPYGIGVIPGGIAGHLVGIVWYWKMTRSENDNQKPGALTGGGLGMAMGLIATLALHLSMALIVSPIVNLFPHLAARLNMDDMIASQYLPIMLIGLPIGAVAGGILGGFFGLAFQEEYDTTEEDPEDEETPSPTARDADE